jgi:hypothetical protein
MRFTEGTYTRKLTEQKDISFLLNKSFISNTTGSVYFGFTGEGKTLQWKFEKGEIRDPENQVVGSYSPSEIFVLSGDISDNYYNYSIDNISIVRGKTKDNFKIENLFVNCSESAYLDTSLYVYSDGINYDFTLQDTVTIGESITGQLTNNSSDGKLLIHSATLKNQALTNYDIVSFPSYIDPSSSGSFTFSSTNAVSGEHSFEMDLETNIGKISVTDTIIASAPETVFTLNKLEEYSINASESLAFDQVDSEGYSTFFYHSSMFGGENPTQEVTPTLVHEDGNTGVYHRVTGVSIDTGGIGYTSQATVTFNGAQGNDVNAEGIAIMDFVSGKVTSVIVTKPGVYYGSAPTITFGGSSTISALGSVQTETYDKTFLSSWEIYTGLSPETTVSNGFTASSGIYENSDQVSLTDEQNFYIKIKGKSFYDFDTIKAKLKVTGTRADSNTNRVLEEMVITLKNNIT